MSQFIVNLWNKTINTHGSGIFGKKIKIGTYLIINNLENPQ